MPRKPNIDKPQRLEISFPESEKGQLDLLLLSEVEGRVPLGSYSNFFRERLREYLDWKRIDLGAFGFPPGYFVSGPKEMIQLLEERLKK